MFRPSTIMDHAEHNSVMQHILHWVPLQVRWVSRAEEADPLSTDRSYRSPRASAALPLQRSNYQFRIPGQYSMNRTSVLLMPESVVRLFWFVSKVEFFSAKELFCVRRKGVPALDGLVLIPVPKGLVL